MVADVFARSLAAMSTSIRLRACICTEKEISGESARSGRKRPPCSRDYYPTTGEDVHQQDLPLETGIVVPHGPALEVGKHEAYCWGAAGLGDGVSRLMPFRKA